ncbi:hypothetical protein PV08_03751 [Exophiala spinifera]|uniref:NAD-dependent epimerase/dehydratase domain-containing protein n=1 Tax=Exophiala spinifera TaxID=91928 RepID=A0A0D2BC77_9EURO|nr:uncharacterized protein PV08_03751 [Exophiala spinifera]KIW16563.1 hypothetical protein PV08_03751 [Exophiala spinifera]
MSDKLILLTGGTGHIGFRTLVEALSKGYHVRAAVRSESKTTQIRTAKSVQPFLEQLEFTIVPDITKPGAFDDAMRSVNYVVHLASPLGRATDDFETNIIQPAVQGTLSILHSALKEPSVERVVITASLASVSPSTPRPFTADNTEEDPEGPFPDPFTAYVASKKLALNRTRQFLAQEKPHFSIINVMPSFVIGKNELATTPEAVNSGSNSRALGPILGNANAVALPGAVCHIDDVSFVHIAALDPKVDGNQNFGVNWRSSSFQWDDALEIVRKLFPEEVSRGIFPLGGSQSTGLAEFDASKTEDILGIKFKNFEEQILSLAGHYAEVSASA